MSDSDQWTVAYQGLIKSIAKKICDSFGCHRLWDDLIQEGKIALVEAEKSFDPERGVKLSTYAYDPIKWAMRSYALKNIYGVSIPCDLDQFAARVRQAHDAWMKWLERKPLVEEIAEYLNLAVSLPKIIQVLEAHGNLPSARKGAQEKELEGLPDEEALALLCQLSLEQVCRIIKLWQELAAESASLSLPERIHQMLAQQGRQEIVKAMALINCQWESTDSDEAGAATDKLADTKQSPAQAAEEKSRLEQLKLAITKLPAHDRELIKLHHYEEVSIKVIAEMKGKSEEAIKQDLFRARKRLKKILE